MNHRILKATLIASALLFSASLSFAAENKAPAAEQSKAIGKKSEKSAKVKRAKAAKVKLVDINGADKAELKTLPGISDADAEKIIAGRPYLSKANLVTHKIISLGVYQQLKEKVIAKQKKK